MPHGESSDADWWPGVYCTALYSTVLYTVHGHLSRLTWCRQVAASGVAPASARGPASATLAAHTGRTQHCTPEGLAFSFLYPTRLLLSVFDQREKATGLHNVCKA